MLDIGFFELLVVAVIALLVVGPERMPILVRTIAAWIKRIKDFIGSVQHDIAREIQTEDIKRTLQRLQQTPIEQVQTTPTTASETSQQDTTHTYKTPTKPA